ncbi:hypothetical protein [Streptomyces sp. NPDC048312]|uniref:hypothetical protein n=1 Tax=Streptomyces sp. NPDC048312 TaxID=3155485 RepID=UPI0033ECA1C7
MPHSVSPRSQTSLPQPHPRRWWALGVLGPAQLMILLDSAIVNVALPSLQSELHNGASFLAIMTGATADVPAQDAGIASASVNSAQQMGGSIGSAVFNTVAASAETAFHGSARTATLHGFTTAVRYPLAALLLAAVVTAALARKRGRPASPKPDRPTEGRVIDVSNAIYGR